MSTGTFSFLVLGILSIIVQVQGHDTCLMMGLVLTNDFCTTDLSVDRSNAQIWNYSIDMCSRQSRHGIPSIPHLLLTGLAHKIDSTRQKLRRVYRRMLRYGITMQQNQCNLQSRYLHSIHSATTMNELLVRATEAVSAMSLNLTIVNCHLSSVLFSDVYSDSADVIVYIRILLYRVRYDQSLCQPQISLPSSLTPERLLPFSCKNLSRAISLYTALGRKLNELWRSETSYS